jgi:ribose 5-phosphate isomerase B
LEQRGHELCNHGTNNEDSVDYADFIHPVAQDVEDNNASLGIIVCGSGNGAAMTANKHQKIRAALCWSPEISKLSRQHNDANIISIPSRFVNLEQALKMVDLFISTPFEGGRHQNRIEKIPCR